MVADIEESLEMTQTQTQNDSQSQEDLDLNSLIGILTYTNNGTDYYLLKNNTSHVWNIGRNVGNWVVINDSSVSTYLSYYSHYCRYRHFILQVKNIVIYLGMAN